MKIHREEAEDIVNKTLKLFKKNEQTLDKLEQDIKKLKTNLF